MSSSLRRGALAASALALSIAALTACGAGPNAQSLNIQPDNASVTVEDIKVQNVNIITSEDESGPASVSARLFNQGTEDERLESIKISGREVELSPAEGDDLTVPAGGSLILGGENNASALIPDPAAADIHNGEAQEIVFELSSTGKVELRATVVPATDAWAEFGPSGAPQPTAEATEPGPETSPGTSEDSPEIEAEESEASNDTGDDDTQGEIGNEETHQP
ncbi:lipoprotein [Streptomyces glaucosporus]|uniref:Lipoprotein n=1 Tax=Streptomyces glaucosporus TaxID=284044 RepID=A0ABP5USR8_9ACTN